MVAIVVWHVNPDNIAYVGPYSLDEARNALTALQFRHNDADPANEQEESWEADNVAGSEGVSLLIEERAEFDYRPDQLHAAIFAS